MTQVIKSDDLFRSSFTTCRVDLALKWTKWTDQFKRNDSKEECKTFLT